MTIDMKETRKKRRRPRYRRPGFRFRNLWILLLGVLILFVLLIGAHWIKNRAQKPEVRGDHTLRYAYEEQVEYEGAAYRQRRNITTVLLMGVDRDSNAIVQGYRNGGQADFLRLIVIDNDTKTVKQIAIDRDTMTPITVLGVLGNQSGMRTAQVSLSHGFGNGGTQSCELTEKAVSNLFFGIPIDFYIAMNLDGISELNDLLGGVTVTLEDDFSSLDPNMTSGSTLTLMGDQAEYYVRSRMNIGIGTNEARMTRQENYISQLATLLKQYISEDEASIGTVYDALDPYLTTNAARGRLINEVWTAKDYTLTPVISPAGRHEVAADGFMQFYVDETALKQSVMDLFYEEIK